MTAAAVAGGVAISALAIITGFSDGIAHAATPEASAPWRGVDKIVWPDGTVQVRCENVEGIVILYVKAVSSASGDTVGPFVLDTGAGYLALDASLAQKLGLTDQVDTSAVGVTTRPLARLLIGTWEQDVVSPVLTFDAEIARRVTARPVLGLIGQRLYHDRALWLDYDAEQLAFVPSTAPPDTTDEVPISRAALAPTLTGRATPVRFRLLGDGKVVVRATVANADGSGVSKPLTLIVDTGSSKTVLFEHALDAAAPAHRDWSTLSGMSAPTLVGDAGARMTRIPRLRLEDARTDVASAAPTEVRQDAPPPRSKRRAHAPDAGAGAVAGPAECLDSDAALIDGELVRMLSADIGEPVHGLLGYSFLRHYRVVFDYPRRVLWLDPRPDDHDERPYEYTHVGLQLERRGGAIVVTGVVQGSPAELDGIRPGDELVSLDGHAASGGDLIEVARALEGPAGTSVRLVTRRAGVESTHRLTRKRLL